MKPLVYTQEKGMLLQAPLVVNRHLLRSGAEENVIKNVTVKAGT